MDTVFSALAGLLGMSMATIYVIWMIIGALNLLWAVVCAAVAAHYGRSGFSWFFLGGIYGLVAFILLLVAGRLLPEERDRMSRFLWLVLIIPVILVILFAVFALLSGDSVTEAASSLTSI